MLDLLTSGFSVVFAPKMLLPLIFAVFLGTLVRRSAGRVGHHGRNPWNSLHLSDDSGGTPSFLSAAIYCASVTGGGMTAILFKILLGVPSSAPTTYDGYPMAYRGGGQRPWACS